MVGPGIWCTVEQVWGRCMPVLVGFALAHGLQWLRCAVKTLATHWQATPTLHQHDGFTSVTEPEGQAHFDVVVVGGGAAGLSVAACAQQQGLSCVVLDQNLTCGAVWRARYDRLHLHTPKNTSSLPFVPFPETFPLFPSKDQVVYGVAVLLLLLCLLLLFAEVDIKSSSAKQRINPFLFIPSCSVSIEVERHTGREKTLF